MKGPEREARRWFLQAEDDLRFVEWVWKEGRFFDKGCFISQQAGEKALKACLYARGERRVIGHSLFEMVQDISNTERSFSTVVDEARRLDRFYTTARYPNAIPGGSPFQIYTGDDLAEAYKDVKKVFEVTRKFLQKKGIAE